MKTQWEKEKLLVMSNVLFSHSAWRTFCHFQQVQNCGLHTLLVWKSKKICCLERVITFCKGIYCLFHWLWFSTKRLQLQRIIQCTSFNSSTLYHTIPTFNDPKKESFWKHWGKKEKMLVTSIFSFSHNVFYPSQNEFQVLSHIWFAVCKCFQLEKV